MTNLMIGPFKESNFSMQNYAYLNLSGISFRPFTCWVAL